MYSRKDDIINKEDVTIRLVSWSAILKELSWGIVAGDAGALTRGADKYPLRRFNFRADGRL